MALASPSLTLAMPALFGNIKPVLDAVKKLGATDFTDEAPMVDIAPGATIKIPVSSVSKAGAYDADSNNYLTGGATDWAQLTASHYLQGFDISGVNLDQGVDAAKMKQKFTVRAGAGIAMAVQDNIKTALNGLTPQDQVTLTTVAGENEPTVDEYMALADSVNFLNKSTSVLAVNGAMLAGMKKKFAGINIAGTLDELAQFCGFAGGVFVPGMTPRAAIVPAGAMGFLGRVPAVIARFMEAGTQTDDDTGLTIGIVVADDQGRNRIVANADLWFGTALKSASYASATSTWTPGAIKVA